MSERQAKKMNIAIIGAGIAGLSCATRLKMRDFEVRIFEKSLRPSGRMSTRNGDQWSADHGTQYFTARDPLFIEELNTWIKNGVAGAKSISWERYIIKHSRNLGISDGGFLF